MKYADRCDLQPSHIELSIHVSNLFSIQWCNFLRLTTNLLSWKKSKHVERWPFWKVGEIFAIASLVRRLQFECTFSCFLFQSWFNVSSDQKCDKSAKYGNNLNWWDQSEAERIQILDFESTWSASKHGRNFTFTIPQSGQVACWESTAIF